jgi:hypothetical protein
MTSEPNPQLNPAGNGERIGATDASQGQKTGHIRWVLAIGTLLAIIALAVVGITMGATH